MGNCEKCGDPIPDEDTLCAYCDFKENPEEWGCGPEEGS